MNIMIKILTTLLFLFYGASIMATPLHEKKLFTQVEHPEFIINKFLSENSIAGLDGEFAIRSPIKATIYVTLKENTIWMTTTLENTSSTEWFISNDVSRVIVKDTTDPTLRDNYDLNGSRPRDTPDDGRSDRRAITDADYQLFLPKEIITYQFGIPVEQFYKDWYRKNAYIQFASNSIPPSLEKRLQELRQDKRFFDAVVSSNKVRIYCYDYDKSRNQYLCEIDNNYS